MDAPTANRPPLAGAASMATPFKTRLARAVLFVVIGAAQFATFEVALRVWGHSEAAPAFQALFMPDPTMGYRLRPNARTRFVTSEFDTTIAINGSGVRDDREIGPKPPGEFRIVVLGDSLVLSVQVPREEAFCQLLEDALNQRAGTAGRVRVINAGVQGYGPVEDLLFFRKVASRFKPDLVIVTIFVGNDAEDAVTAEPKLHERPALSAAVVAESVTARLRRLVRRSMVLQVVRVRIVSVTDRLPTWRARPEPPLQSFAARPAARIARGLDISRDCVAQIAAEARTIGARTAVVLMPARFQVDDADYGRLRAAVSQAGGTLVRDAATNRFDAAMSSLSLPQMDVLPALRAAMPGSDLFFQHTVHLTPRGHQVVAAALARFLVARGLAGPES